MLDKSEILTKTKTPIIFLSDAPDSKIKELVSMKSFIKTKSFWIIGGDGWAYDIGYNGIDHVISNKENVIFN